MRVATTVAALVLTLLVTVSPARAGEDTDKITVRVTVTLRNGQTMDGTLISGTKDGELTLRTDAGDQTLARDSWYAVAPARRPAQFADAEALYRDGKYEAAAQKYESIYATFEHLYVFGAEALDGQGQALLKAGRPKEAVAAYERLLREYTGADVSPARRYWYARALTEAGGDANRDKAIAQLEYIVDVTDDAVTVRSLYRLGQLYYDAKRYMQALRSNLRLIVLYGNLSDNETQGIVAKARQNALACCEKLSKSSDPALKKRAESIAARLKNL
jgi:tetratricopeptide (TPR) repeat protein